MAETKVVTMKGKCPGCSAEVPVRYRIVLQGGSYRFYSMETIYPTCSLECEEIYRLMRKQKGGYALLTSQEINELVRTQKLSYKGVRDYYAEARKHQ